MLLCVNFEKLGEAIPFILKFIYKAFQTR